VTYVSAVTEATHEEKEGKESWRGLGMMKINIYIYTCMEVS
jgi:hypothetical protein